VVHQSNKFNVTVATSLAVPKLLDYVVESDINPEIGCFVSIEVGTKQVSGVVVNVQPMEALIVKNSKLKKAEVLKHVPPLTAPMAQFVRFASRYTFALPGDPVRAALIAGKIPEQVEPDSYITLGSNALDKKTVAREKVLDTLSCGGEYTSQSALAEKSGVGAAVVKGLLDKNVLSWQKKEDVKPSFDIQLPPLNASQQQAAAEVAQVLSQKKHQTFFLDGVMGSGKTEVYFDSIARLLEEDDDSQILLLVPEIALTPQLVGRFEKRFGFVPTLWHSNLGEKTKRRHWWQIAKGLSRVVIGARSALFLNYQNLRLIVVDEEHDSSYKQEEVFRYHGRDMAVTLGHFWKCPVLLCSATPSIETWQNVLDGRYTRLILEGRYGEATLPALNLVDMKQEKVGKKDRWISAPILKSIHQRLEKGEQSLVFLNRRGVAPLLICGGCGERVGCPSCDASLVVHKSYLICHHCGFHEAIPKTCPKCDSEKLRAFGPGTRKIKTELEHYFPKAKVLVADSDSVKTDRQMGDVIRKMENGEIDILVGTQMVAKGHHFPNLTFVGIIDGDMGLARGELRAAEKTFQVLMQVAGRAGRAEKKGEVIIQTHDPKHPLFQCLLHMNRDQFLKMEISNRKQWQDPPFRRQIAFIISGKDEKIVAQTSRYLVKNFHIPNIEILGPAPAPLAKLRDKYRYRILVKSSGKLHEPIQKWLAQTKIPSSVRVVVDVDPVSFY
jgi:primosomal protein N' (replication factor Y)